MRVGSPLVTSMVPVIFSVASSITKILFGQPPTYSVPLPPVSFTGAGAPAETTEKTANTETTETTELRNIFSDLCDLSELCVDRVFRFSMASTWEDEIELAPVFLRRRAFGRPV